MQAPGLAVVLVGGRKDSQSYVRNKKKACVEVGIVDFGTDLPEDATEEDVLQVRYNPRPPPTPPSHARARTRVHGFHPIRRWICGAKHLLRGDIVTQENDLGIRFARYTQGMHTYSEDPVFDSICCCSAELLRADGAYDSPELIYASGIWTLAGVLTLKG